MEFTVEQAIEPELPIVDCHHHLWDPTPQLPNDVPLGVTPRYLLPELLADLSSGHDVRATVYAECGSGYRKDGPAALRPVGETEFANAVADEHARSGDDRRVIAGIISHADMMLGDAIGDVLDAHIAAAPDRFRGIRYGLLPNLVANRYVDTDRIMFRPGFRAALNELGKRGLLFEVMVSHLQLEDTLSMVRASPDTDFVLNHVGAPMAIGPFTGQVREVFEAWKPGIAALGKEPNVVVKLGGLAMFMTGFGWHERERSPSSEEMAQTFRPYLDHAIESFGPLRGMFESNFPPDSISGRYVTLWNAFKRATAHYAPAERAALFHDTAMRVYRL
jgi:predicted TIM-barrel fold metal-dependent hydrolase